MHSFSTLAHAASNNFDKFFPQFSSEQWNLKQLLLKQFHEAL